MKKITKQLFFSMLGLLSISAFAQIPNTTGLPGDDLIFYEDTRNIDGSSGYQTFEVLAPESFTINSKIPVDGAANTLGYNRPADNYPAGDAVANRSARLRGNNGSENWDVDIWYVINSIDLSAYDGGTKYFTFSTLNEFREDGGTNFDDDANVYYTTGFATGTDPTAGATWTPITATPLGSSVAMGTDGIWTTQSLDLSAITAGTEFAIAIRRQCDSGGPTGGAFSSSSNRNGAFYVSDLTYTGTAAPLSVQDDILNDAVSVYPNPAKNKLNLNISDTSINIKSTTLIDITGKVIYNTNNFVNTVDISKFSRGLYILKLESEAGGVLTKKVLLN